VAGLAGYVVVRISWRLHIVSRWRLRRDRHRLQKLLRQDDPGAP
jgi:hypothetical protein